jgi:LysM repeat protein
MLSRLALAAALIVAGSSLAFAQSDFDERSIPPSSPPSRVISAPPATSRSRSEPDTDQPPEAAVKPAAPSHALAQPSVRPDHPANIIPYTVRPGDTINAIAQMFGVTPEEIAHANRIHADDGLLADEVLKIPHPFTNEITTLRSQLESINAQSQAVQQKADAASEQVKSLQAQVQELTGDNQDLQSVVKIMPWWRATAVSLGFAALIMFGMMLLTLFEWWRMRRRFIALAEMTDALGRLDYKYKAMIAKAELRLQQLYGRRRQGITEGQPRPKMPEEVEIERLNDELKEILQHHLQRLGARLPGSKRRKSWRELLNGSDVGSAVEARSARR